MTASESRVEYGHPISLSCSIHQPPSVDTPTNISVNWTSPSNRHDGVKHMRNNIVNITDDLVIPRAQAEDSGWYICTVSVYDASGSQFISTSESSSDTLCITVGR